MQQVAPAINFEDNLRRARGRTSRNHIASARVTKAEQDELEAAARADGKALSEWCRETLLLTARGQIVTPEFTEIVAMRSLLMATLKHLACGKVMTPEAFAEELKNIRLTKHTSAAQLMQQYQEKETER